MPKAPSPKRAEAKSLYLASGGHENLRSIAEKLEVPEGTLRGWKTKDHWDEELSGTLRKKKRNAPKKKGAPKGNKNAAGHVGAKLLGEDNGNYRHGAYAGIYLDVLSDKECEIMESDPDTEEALLIEQIRLLSVREVRLLEAIKDVKAKAAAAQKSNGGLIPLSAKKSITSENSANPKTYYKLEKVSEIVTTEAVKTDPVTVILKLEASLTQVQSRKTRCIKSLADLRMQREKLDLVKLQMGVGDNDQLRRAVELLGGIESAF